MRTKAASTQQEHKPSKVVGRAFGPWTVTAVLGPYENDRTVCRVRCACGREDTKKLRRLRKTALEPSCKCGRPCAKCGQATTAANGLHAACRLVGARPGRTEEQAVEARAMRAGGATLRYIAEALGISLSAVSAACAKRIPCTCGAESVGGRCRACGARSAGDARRRPGWRRIVPDGYVLVLGDDGRPILEHRKVMAEMVGRPLLPHENVHHKNGDRADNRPENLELWSKVQPSGQRVTDQVAWAREVLRQNAGGYEEDAHLW